MAKTGKLAVVICNYNGGEDTVNCVKAVFDNDYKDIDIYVVDNASEDDSIKLVCEEYEDRVSILYNDENRGGSGGFGRGLRYAIEHDYEYIMVLDNDAFIDTDTVGKLFEYISTHSDVGVVGAKIMMLDDRNRIFDFAKNMYWDTFHDGSEWVGQLDSDVCCKAVECDYVAATTAIIRATALVSAGGMDEEHFIYYDDIELCQRIRMAGYAVVCLGTTRAWHKSNISKVPTNTFARYYHTRNRYRFFAKYLPEEKLEEFADYVLDQSFPYIYGSHISGREDMFFTTKYILEDFMNDVRGKARPGRVNVMRNTFDTNIKKLIGENKKIAICMMEGGRETTLQKVVNVLNNCDDVTFKLVSSLEVADYNLVIAICNHVKDQTQNILPAVYIDAYGNIIEDYDTYLYFQNYENAQGLFKHMYKHSVMEGIMRIRK